MRELPDIIVVPDIGPLLHLARADALPLLHEVGRRVVITEVAIEAKADRSEPEARALRDWLEAGQAAGSPAPVSIETTEVGRALLTARKADPAFRWPGAAELSLIVWLREYLDRTEGEVLVVYEAPTVARVLGDAPDIDRVTTRAFLERAGATFVT